MTKPTRDQWIEAVRDLKDHEMAYSEASKAFQQVTAELNASRDRLTGLSEAAGMGSVAELALVTFINLLTEEEGSGDDQPVPGHPPRLPCTGHEPPDPLGGQRLCILERGHEGRHSWEVGGPLAHVGIKGSIFP